MTGVDKTCIINLIVGLTLFLFLSRSFSLSFYPVKKLNYKKEKIVYIYYKEE